MSVVEYYLTQHYTNIIWQLLTFEPETTILQVVWITHCLVSACTVMYCLVLVNWNLLVEEVVKGTSNREDQGMRLVPILWH